MSNLPNHALEHDGGDDPAGVPASETARADRLRRAVLALDATTLRDALDSLPQHLQASLATRAKVALATVRRGAGVTRWLRRVPAGHWVWALVAGHAGHECLDAVRDALGPCADHPTADEVRTAVAGALDGFPPAVVAVMLARIAATGATAAVHCDAVLDEDPALRIPTDVEIEAWATAPDVTLAPARAHDEAKREARRARKSEAKQARAADRRERTPSQPPRRKRLPASADPATAPDVACAGPRPVAPSPPVLRPPSLPPRLARKFDTGHDLVTSVVLADIPFDRPDPLDPMVTSKTRPVVVVGVSRTQLLVRAGYSEGGVRSRDWKCVELVDWREAGLLKTSWIDGRFHKVARRRASRPVGWLSARDWNQLW